nr:hypothetical protein [uncultured Sphaerochaeta sp.]
MSVISGCSLPLNWSRDKKTKEVLVPYGRDPEGIMKSITGRLAKKGFMTYSHENMVIVAPPLIITEAQLREEMVKLDEVLGEVDAQYCTTKGESTLS